MIETLKGSAFRLALSDSLPILFGYLPLGMAFGILFDSLGYAWAYAPIAGIIIYAGSAQFLAVGLITSGASLLEIFMATFALNFRHIFYGLSVFDRYPKSGLRRWYLIFGLTDETYAVITGKPAPDIDQKIDYYFHLTLLSQSYWILGCGIGAGLQSWFEFDSRGFEFTLVALFLVILIEQIRILQNIKPVLIASAGASGALILFDNQFLAVAIGFSALVIAMDYRLDFLND